MTIRFIGTLLCGMSLAPVTVLGSPIPVSKLQTLVSTDVEKVVVARRGGAVARGGRGGSAPKTTTVKSSKSTAR
jgi:hypothetical protein